MRYGFFHKKNRCRATGTGMNVTVHIHKQLSGTSAEPAPTGSASTMRGPPAAGPGLQLSK